MANALFNLPFEPYANVHLIASRVNAGDLEGAQEALDLIIEACARVVAALPTEPTAAPEQAAERGEPVAWLWTGSHGHVQAFTSKPPPSMLRDPQCQPLYLAPQPVHAEQRDAARWRFARKELTWADYDMNGTIRWVMFLKMPTPNDSAEALTENSIATELDAAVDVAMRRT